MSRYYVQQLYTSCLAEAAYYIESNGEAAIVDPMRETEPYLELAASRGAKIKYIVETHFHADFVSGHLDLARKTGATIVYGPTAQPAFTVHVAQEGEELKVGDIALKVLHTPGHTPESSCFLLLDETRTPQAVFTGDTLFVGDVGRPDLAVKSDLSQADLAGMLYDSLNRHIKTLPDHVVVYPAHGAGSACGKNIGKETHSTIGIQKQTNYALQDMSREAFIAAVTDGLSAPPAYFFFDARVNREGYSSLDEVMASNLQPLQPGEFEEAQAQGALVLDCREPVSFEKGFVPGALNIGLNGQYAVWVGTLIPTDARLLLVAEPGKEAEAVLRLARVGYENVVGYLDGGMDSWKTSGRAVDEVKTLTAEEFAKRVDMKLGWVLDVRNAGECESNGVVPGAQLLPLGQLEARMGEVPTGDTVLIHCAGGYRSMIAASLLKRNGIHNVVNIGGGFGAIKQTSCPIVQLQTV